MLPFVKTFIVSKVVDFTISYVDKNWDSLVALGKGKVLNLLNMLKAKLTGEDEKAIFGSGKPSPMEIEFQANLDAVFARAQEEAPTEE